MEQKQIIEELRKDLNIIETFDKDSAQDAQVLHEYLIHLTNIMARANYIMAESQREFRQEKKTAYLRLAASSQAQQNYYAPSLAKDYIDSQCSESGYIFDLAERLSRSCTHTIDAIRTIISSLKSERAMSGYNV